MSDDTFLLFHILQAFGSTDALFMNCSRTKCISFSLYFENTKLEKYCDSILHSIFFLQLSNTNYNMVFCILNMYFKYRYQEYWASLDAFAQSYTLYSHHSHICSTFIKLSHDFPFFPFTFLFLSPSYFPHLS